MIAGEYEVLGKKYTKSPKSTLRKCIRKLLKCKSIYDATYHDGNTTKCRLIIKKSGETRKLNTEYTIINYPDDIPGDSENITLKLYATTILSEEWSLPSESCT